MLAIFHKKIAHGPASVFIDRHDAYTMQSGCKSNHDLLQEFLSSFPQAVHLRFDEVSCMAYSHEREKTLFTPRSFAASDDIFCLFQGGLDNLGVVRQRYGLSKGVKEPLLVIEAYRALRDRAPYPAHQVVGDLSGPFAFLLYDLNTRKIFVAVDSHGKVPLFWGSTSNGSIAFSDDEELIKASCGTSFAIFPQGCYFSSDEGLRSFEHPLRPLKVVPHIDKEGQAYGSIFIVDHTQRVAGTRVV